MDLSSMLNFNGDDLLKVFSQLNVNLGDLNPNTVRGWFDTDDKDMKNLLAWMCTSLSKKNYLCPLEYVEYQAIKMPLSNEKLDNEIQLIEREYPGIFNLEQNALDIELLEDEINILLQNEKDLDELISLDETLHNNLSTELNKQMQLEIKTTTKLCSTQDYCNKLAEELDIVNSKIHSQLVICGDRLCSIEFGSCPLFINHMDIRECQEKFYTLNSELFRDLENYTSLNHSNIINTSLNITGLSHLFSNDLYILCERILNSQQNYMACKVEVMKLKEISNFLNKIRTNDILALKIDTNVDDVETKEDQKKIMSGMLDTVISKSTDQQISAVKLKFVQHELDMHQLKLKELSDIEDALLQLLSVYLFLFLIYQIEEQEIYCLNNFIKKLINYVREDLQNCKLRMENMKKLIESANKDNRNNWLLTKTIFKILSYEDNDGSDCKLSKAFNVIMTMKREINTLETKLFCPSFLGHHSVADKLKNNINILQSFLVCGPTHRIVLIPHKLHSLLLIVQEIVKKQKASIKSALQISTTSKKNPNKWMNLRRQLWMYFYGDAQKLNFCIQQVEAELAKLGGII